jgi:tetratricopeptide (TPR) repeat protein
MNKQTRTPLLHQLYHRYLSDQDTEAFGSRVAGRYGIGTLERLAAAGDRMARRAAVLALSLIGDYQSNAVLGRALGDRDRGVRMLAENGICALWGRVGTAPQREQLQTIMQLNSQSHRFQQAVDAASRLINDAPWMAEAWNQRAIAWFHLGRFSESIKDCTQALEINPYHFAAASGMAQCHLQLNNRTAALECFRRALALNPNLEGVRAQVLYLERTLKSQG